MTTAKTWLESIQQFDPETQEMLLRDVGEGIVPPS